MGDALQDTYFAGMTCFGCGPANADGLQLKSHLAADGTTVATFAPWPQHDNGLGFLNGGIIATLLDCHSGITVTHAAHDHGWPALPGVPLPYVTAGLDVRYRRPAPLDQPVTLVAELSTVSEPEMVCHVRLEWDGKVRAEADAVWKRWRPR